MSSLGDPFKLEVENLKSNLEHWIREERLRALERQTDAEVASTQAAGDERCATKEVWAKQSQSKYRFDVSKWAINN